jgi:hypothetical protein
MVDASAAFVLGVFLAPSLGMYFSQRAVVALQMDSATSLWKGPLPLILGAFGKLVYLMPLMLLVVFVTEPLFHRSVGKLVTGQQLSSSTGSVSMSAHAAWRRFILKACPLIVAVVGLIVGRWELLVAATLLSLLVAAAFVPVLFGHSALYDRWSSTHVSRG